MFFTSNFRRSAAIALALVAFASCRQPVALAPIPENILKDVSFIGDVRREGRVSGSSGSIQVANYIADRYRALSLHGAFIASCGVATCNGEFFQSFSHSRARNARNVGAIIPGTDPVLRNEFVVIGAHYDHVGSMAGLSLDPDKGMQIRPGADDNASGTAAVLELGRRFATRPLRRSVILVHFDAEELGLLGSEHFVRQPPFAIRQMKFMLNLDMVGRLKQGKLEIDKSTLMYDDPPLLAVFDSATKALHMRRGVTNEIGDRSDHANFRRFDVSSVAFFTGFHKDYHRTTDVVSKLDVRGIGQVVDVAEAMVRFAADRK